MKTITIKIETVKVEPAFIKVPFIVKMGSPIFGMSEEARKSFGMSKKDLKNWKKQMKKYWKHGKNN